MTRYMNIKIFHPYVIADKPIKKTIGSNLCVSNVKSYKLEQ